MDNALRDVQAKTVAITLKGGRGSVDRKSVRAVASDDGSGLLRHGGTVYGT